MNVSSVVVKTAPENLDAVLKGLRKSGLCEVYFYDEKGVIIVTIEGHNIGEEMNKMKSILNMPHVLAADLAFSYTEDEVREAIEQHKNIADIADFLNATGRKA